MNLRSSRLPLLSPILTHIFQLFWGSWAAKRCKNLFQFKLTVKFYRKMLRCVHQLVSNFIRLLPGAERVVYFGLLELLCWNQDNKVVCRTDKQWAESLDSGDNSLTTPSAVSLLNKQNVNHAFWFVNSTFVQIHSINISPLCWWKNIMMPNVFAAAN